MLQPGTVEVYLQSRFYWLCRIGTDSKFSDISRLAPWRLVRFLWYACNYYKVPENIF